MKQFLQFRSLIIALVLIVAVLCGGFFLYNNLIPAAEAQSGIPAGLELAGYAWSSNIGWISMNCATGNSSGGNVCSSSNYRVIITTAGAIEGYAWSPNIGWIRFGGLNDFPSGGGTHAGNASVTGTYPNLTFRGWARACSVFASGCSGSLRSDAERGGWDGWISLAGTNYSVRTGSTGMSNNSYAWGSTVVGWIDMFSHMSVVSTIASLTISPCAGGGIPTGASTCTGSLTWNFNPATASPQVRRTVPAPITQLSTNLVGVNVSTPLSHGTNTFDLRSGSNSLSPAVTATITVGCANPTDQFIGGACRQPVVANLTVSGCPVPLGANTCTGRLNWGFDPVTPSPSVRRTVPITETVSTNLTGTSVATTLTLGTNTFDLRSNGNPLSPAVVRTVNVGCATGTENIGNVCMTPLVITITPSAQLVRKGDPLQIIVTLSRPLESTESCRLIGGSLDVPITTSRTFTTTIENKTNFTVICENPITTNRWTESVEVAAPTIEI